jgi:CheY-like chemotaxis protein
MKTRVLVVEDNANMLELLSRQLECLDYEVIVAKNGLEALAIALSQQPDLIVMDVVMPKMDGLEAVSRIRDNPRTGNIPVLAATGWLYSTSREQYLASGFDDFLAKPFTHRELHVAIERLLNQSEKGPERSGPPARSADKSK